MKKPIRIDTPRKKNALVGYIYTKDEVYIFMKKVKRLTHYMNIMKGYGIQEVIWDEYLKDKVGWVWIFESDKNKHLLSPISMWEEKSVIREITKEDGKQRFLSEKYMFRVENIPDAIKTMKTATKLPLSEDK